MFLEAEDPEKDINLYVNSPAQHRGGLSIYDDAIRETTDQHHLPRRSQVSMGACPHRRAKGNLCLPNARVMIHQPLGGFQGQATEIDIHAREILKIRERLNDIMAKHTGQPIEKISHDTERDYFMSAEEAKKYGLIDEVISRQTKGLKSVESGDAAKDGAKGK